jgi:hypothetical protein
MLQRSKQRHSFSLKFSELLVQNAKKYQPPNAREVTHAAAPAASEMDQRPNAT